MNEFWRVLIRKFRVRAEAIPNVIQSILPDVEIVEPATFPAQICRDPDDDAILGTAVAGNADCIVTGDSDLLVLERLVCAGVAIDIITPVDFPRYEEKRL
ncbi:MAG: putative toxin-antitoxin system toxin component, PIN family [Chloroflexi bacterium]|nr:putative toxin-antitoxin system toxin component, PIN family [Chloroflexota bacterium]